MPPGIGEPILYSVFKMPNVSPLDDEARFLKALTHPARLAIVDVLRRDEACVCHLEAVLGQRQAFISQHLMILRDAGIVQDRRVASNVFYRIADRRAVNMVSVGGTRGAVTPVAGSSSTGVTPSADTVKPKYRSRYRPDTTIGDFAVVDRRTVPSVPHSVSRRRPTSHAATVVGPTKTGNGFLDSPGPSPFRPRRWVTAPVESSSRSRKSDPFSALIRT